MQRPKARIFSSFSFLNITQFLGALNDNIFKLVIAFLLIHMWGKGASNTIFATTGFVYVLPFLLFSIPAGTLADKFSKRNITVATKALEVVTMTLGVIAFGLESAWGSYAVLFLMATQSAIFGPSKYAVVPELVHEKQISKANGILTALTVLAMIIGFFLGGFLTEITNYNFVFIALFCVGVSLLGLLASICIEKTPAMGTERKQTVRVVTQMVRILIRTRKENYLFESLLGSAYFYLVGGYVQLNIVTYTIQSLGLSEIAGAYLFLTAAIGIATGSLISGMLCGRKVELGLTPLAALGMTLFAALLLLFDHNLVWVVICLILLGGFGGIFLVPFDAYIQAASPNDERGENVSCGNFLSFVGILIASGLIYLLGNLLGFSAAQGFFVIAGLTLLVTIWLFWRMSDTLVRLASRWTMRHWKIVGDIPQDDQIIFICEKPEILPLITLQQRYMRFAIDLPPTLTTRLCKADKTKAERWLKRGYSLTVEDAEYGKRLAKEKGLPLMQAVIEDHVIRTSKLA